MSTNPPTYTSQPNSNISTVGTSPTYSPGITITTPSVTHPNTTSTPSITAYGYAAPSPGSVTVSDFLFEAEGIDPFGIVSYDMPSLFPHTESGSFRLVSTYKNAEALTKWVREKEQKDVKITIFDGARIPKIIFSMKADLMTVRFGKVEQLGNPYAGVFIECSVGHGPVDVKFLTPDEGKFLINK